MEESAEQKREQFCAKRLQESGVAYSASAVLGVLLSFLLSAVAVAVSGENYAKQNWYLYCAYSVAQIAFAVSAAIYFVRSKMPVKSMFGKCSPKYFALAFLLQFGLLFSLSELNSYFTLFLEKLGYVSEGTPVPDLSGWGILPAIVVIAALPAVFEETVFRGILAKSMHECGWGLAASALVSGALFALFHGSPEQTIYQFLCGVCFALIALRAGSILPTMLAHFANNAVILTFSRFGYDELSSLPFGWYLALVITSAVCLIGSLVYLIFFDKRGNRKGGVKEGGRFFLAAGVGILICAIEWIAVLIMGFFHG